MENEDETTIINTLQAANILETYVMIDEIEGKPFLILDGLHIIL